MNQAETDKPDPKVWQSLAVFRPLPPIRHKAAGLAKRLARRASQAHVLARPVRRKSRPPKAGTPRVGGTRARPSAPAGATPPAAENRVAAESNDVPSRPDSQPYRPDRLRRARRGDGRGRQQRPPSRRGFPAPAGRCATVSHIHIAILVSPVQSRPYPISRAALVRLVPAQIWPRLLLAAADPAGLRPAGAVRPGPDRPGPDDRHRGLVRVPDDPSRPAGVRQRIRAARPAVPAGPAAGGQGAALRSG